MASTELSVGSMFAFALDHLGGATEKSDTGDRRTPRDAMSRRLLEYVLMDHKARQRFVQHAVGISGSAAELRTGSRSAGTGFDLVAPLEGGARLAVVCRVDGPPDPSVLAAQLDRLGSEERSRLLVIAPKAAPAAQTEDPRLVRITWKRLAKVLGAKDVKRAALWQAIGEFGEDAGPLQVHRSVSPRILLEESTTTQMRGLLRAMRLTARILFARPARFSAGRGARPTTLRVGATGSDLGLEFGPVEDGSALWLVGSQPERAFPLGIGVLPDDQAVAAAEARLRGIASGASWRSDTSYVPRLGEFIGTPASPEVESARALLWDVFDARRLTAAGFPLAPRHQPDLSENRVGVRVAYPADPRSGTFLVSIGGSRTWKTLLPRVTREYDGKTYIVQARKSSTAQDLVTDVHGALRSLATKP